MTFENVPAFSAHRDAVLDVPELGNVIVDVAWGGMFYVIADVTQFDALDLVPERGRDITRVGALILRAAQDQLPVEHPDYPRNRDHHCSALRPYDEPERRPEERRFGRQWTDRFRRSRDLDRRDRAVAPRTSPHPTGRFSARSHECGSKGP